MTYFVLVTMSMACCPLVYLKHYLLSTPAATWSLFKQVNRVEGSEQWWLVCLCMFFLCISMLCNGCLFFRSYWIIRGWKLFRPVSDTLYVAAKRGGDIVFDSIKVGGCKLCMLYIFFLQENLKFKCSSQWIIIKSSKQLSPQWLRNLWPKILLCVSVLVVGKQTSDLLLLLLMEPWGQENWFTSEVFVDGRWKLGL